MVFCNVKQPSQRNYVKIVTILILIDGFLQFISPNQEQSIWSVTILILIDGFLQLQQRVEELEKKQQVTILILIDGFLQFEKIPQKLICNEMSQSLF